MSHDQALHMHAHDFLNQDRNFDTSKISKQERSKMSKIIGELNARVRRKLFEEELQKNSSSEEQQKKNSSDTLQNDEFYNNIVDQNETVAEFLDLCNNDTDVNNNDRNNSIDLTTSPTTTEKAENEIINTSIDDVSVYIVF